MQSLIGWWQKLHLFSRIYLVIVVGGGGFLASCFLLLLATGTIGNGAEPEEVSRESVSTSAAVQPSPTLVVAVVEPTATEAPMSTPVPAETSTPTTTPLPEPTAIVAPSEEAADTVQYASRGLGLGRSSFEAAHGKPTGEVAGFYDYGPGLSVFFYDGVVWHLEQSLGEPGMPVSDARALARLWLPQDAEMVETYTTRFGQLVDLYHSPSLADRFPEDEWLNGKPGDHIVIYRRDEGSDLVFGIVIGTGNNP